MSEPIAPTVDNNLPLAEVAEISLTTKTCRLRK